MSDFYLDIASMPGGGLRVTRAETGHNQIVFSGTRGPVVAALLPEGRFPMQVRSVYSDKDGIDVAVFKTYGAGGGDRAMLANSRERIQDLGEMAGDQSCAIANVEAGVVLVAVVQPDMRSYLLTTRDAESLGRIAPDQTFPIPIEGGTSQGMLSMTGGGAILWTDQTRWIDYGGVRLSLPLKIGPFLIGQASPLPEHPTFQKVTVCFNTATTPPKGYAISNVTGAPPRLAIDAASGLPTAAISLLSSINPINFGDWAPFVVPGDGGGVVEPGPSDRVLEMLTALMGEIPARLKAMEQTIAAQGKTIEALRSTVTILDRNAMTHQESLVPWIDGIGGALTRHSIEWKELATRVAAVEAEAKARQYVGRVLGMSATFTPKAPDAK